MRAGDGDDEVATDIAETAMVNENRKMINKYLES